MREIKFRAWDIVNRKMYLPDESSADGISRGVDVPGFIETGLFCISPGGHPIQVESEIDGSYGMRIPTFPTVEVKSDVTIMQYTGLKDRNGKEIYEGDIVKSDDIFGDYEIDGVGVAAVEYLMAEIYPLNNITHSHGKLDCEVIGNIYENPELLEAQ